MDEVEISVDMPAPKVIERPAFGSPGGPIVIGGVVGILAGLTLVGLGIHAAATHSAGLGIVLIVLGALLAIASVIILGGLNVVSPGEARVVQFLGRYTGTIRTDGLRWVNPFTTRRKVSTRIRNHETGVTKVNDADGNPIEIAAVVVWQVQDTAQALFEVDDFSEFVAIQTETAVRHIANSYPYDAHGENQLSLAGQRRGDHDEAVRRDRQRRARRPGSR